MSAIGQLFGHIQSQPLWGERPPRDTRPNAAFEAIVAECDAEIQRVQHAGGLIDPKVVRKREDAERKLAFRRLLTDRLTALEASLRDSKRSVAVLEAEAKELAAATKTQDIVRGSEAHAGIISKVQELDYTLDAWAKRITEDTEERDRIAQAVSAWK